MGKERGQGELAYAIGYAYEGKGIMSKVVASIIQWSFNQASLNKLQIIVHETNLGSIRIAEKNKFTFQGILQEEHEMPDGTLADMKLYEREKETENSYQ